MARGGGHYEPNGPGYALIINNVNFQTFDVRQSSTKDAEDIRDTFSERDFKVHTFTDCTADAIRSHLRALQSPHYKQYRCLFVFFLSHGYQNGIYGTDESCVSIGEIQSHLTAANCPAFKGKAKILVFQSCRIDSRDGPRGSDHPKVLEKDFHLAFATQPDSRAYRHVENGSFYIQCLLEVIKEKSEDEDFLSMLTIVNRRMSENPGIYQAPDRSSHLRDKVYLRLSRRSKIIVPRRHHSSEALDDQLVTPTNSMTSIEIATSVRGTWPVRSRRGKRPRDQRDDTSPSSSDDSNGAEIEKQFDVSMNLEVDSSSTSQTQSVGCGLCVVIGNSNSTRTCELEETFRKLNYHVVVFSDLSQDCLYCLLRAIREVKFEAILFVYSSQCQRNSLVDSCNIEVFMSDIFSYFTDHQCNKLFLFETISGPSDRVDERKQLGGCTLPDKSICLHVSTSRSILTGFGHIVNDFQQHNIVSVRHILEHLLTQEHSQVHWHRTAHSSRDYDYSLRGIESTTEEVQLSGLTLATQIVVQLGTHLISHKTDITKCSQLSRSHQQQPDASLLGAVAVLSHCTAAHSCTGYRLLSQAHHFERQLLQSTVQPILDFLTCRMTAGSEKLMEECVGYFTHSVVDMITSIVTNDVYQWQCPQRCLENLEKSYLSAITRLRDSLLFPYSQPLEEQNLYENEDLAVWSPVEPRVEENFGDVLPTCLEDMYEESSTDVSRMEEDHDSDNESSTLLNRQYISREADAEMIELEQRKLELSGAQQIVILQMVENDGFVELLPTPVRLREVEEDWLELSYRLEKGNLVVAQAVILVERESEDFIELIPTPVQLKEVEEDWLDLSLVRGL